MPLLRRQDAFDLMKILIEVIDEPASNSFLRNNINPLRVGLLLYRLIAECVEIFGYSTHTASIMQESIEEKLVAVLEMYVEPLEVQRMIEMKDYEGHNMFWYLDKYDIFGILDCRILDRIINIKWNGPYDINSSTADYSTGCVVLKDSHQIMSSDRWFQEIMHEMLTFDRNHQTHIFKFEVWKRSMFLRGMIEIGFALFLVVWF